MFLDDLAWSGYQDMPSTENPESPNHEAADKQPAVLEQHQAAQKRMRSTFISGLLDKRPMTKQRLLMLPAVSQRKGVPCTPQDHAAQGVASSSSGSGATAHMSASLRLSKVQHARRLQPAMVAATSTHSHAHDNPHSRLQKLSELAAHVQGQQQQQHMAAHMTRHSGIPYGSEAQHNTGSPVQPTGTQGQQGQQTTCIIMPALPEPLSDHSADAPGDTVFSVLDATGSCVFNTHGSLVRRGMSAAGAAAGLSQIIPARIAAMVMQQHEASMSAQHAATGRSAVTVAMKPPTEAAPLAAQAEAMPAATVVPGPAPLTADVVAEAAVTAMPVAAIPSKPAEEDAPAATDVPIAGALIHDMPLPAATAAEVHSAAGETLAGVAAAADMPLAAPDVPVAALPAPDVPVAAVTAPDVPVAAVTADDVPVAAVPANDVPVAAVTAPDVPAAVLPASNMPLEAGAAADLLVTATVAADMPPATVPTAATLVASAALDMQVASAATSHMQVEAAGAPDMPATAMSTADTQAEAAATATDLQIQPAADTDRPVAALATGTVPTAVMASANMQAADVPVAAPPAAAAAVSTVPPAGTTDIGAGPAADAEDVPTRQAKAWFQAAVACTSQSQQQGSKVANDQST